MRIDRFQLERAQSVHENTVDFNLSESGVQALSIQDLLTSESQRSSEGPRGKSSTRYVTTIFSGREASVHGTQL
jgi:hypothetical protein